MSNIENLQEIKTDIAENTAEVKESVTEIAKDAGEAIESNTNFVLEFFGVPIDINTLMTSLVDWSGKMILALIIFFVGKWIGGRIVRVARGVMNRSNIDITAANFLGNVLYGLMLVAVTLAALNQLGINTNSFVAILGAAAVAIGMSLKDQLSNLAAGVMIVMFRPFNRGDFVEISGKTGTIMDITLVNTRIRTTNNHEIIIPNGNIMTSASINYTSLPQRRMDITVAIAYSSNIQTAREIMLQEANNHEGVLNTPEPLVRVTALGDNGINLTLYAWSENSDWFAAQCDLLESIKYSFDNNGVDLSFPHRLLHIENTDAIANHPKD